MTASPRDLLSLSLPRPTTTLMSFFHLSSSPPCLCLSSSRHRHCACWTRNCRHHKDSHHLPASHPILYTILSSSFLTLPATRLSKANNQRKSLEIKLVRTTTRRPSYSRPYVLPSS
ncbi:hypothetical protein SCHPADRAFT_617222 [Schizopora paradoxa]|uniref:Uncharacterized protein n=1 Tax=Schizopora paradoxa TaxID=27342 RepID=A0A0H2R8K0_9AGAM|nr:hypothetical protein SCHPADRAFT_617222 [Schizopora paradoxa]